MSFKLFKKSRDEIKLDFFNSCVDNAKKYKFSQLTQQQKDFKRKYSWCLDKKNNEEHSRKSATGVSRHNPIQRSVSNVSRCVRNDKRVTSKTQPNGISRAKSFSSSSTQSSSRESTSASGSSAIENVSSAREGTGSGSESGSGSGRGVILSASGRMSSGREQVPRRTSETGAELPNLSRRKSLLEVPSNDRVNHLEKLWNKVFSFDSNDITADKFQRRRRSSMKEDFTGICMQQFGKENSNDTSTHLPDIQNGSWQQTQRFLVRVVPDSELSPQDTNTVQSNDIENEAEDVPENLLPEDDDTNSTDEQTTETSPEETQPKSKPKSRRNSISIPLVKPPFISNFSRPRSMSMDYRLPTQMWQAANFRLLASRRNGQDRLSQLVCLAMQKDKISTTKGRIWRNDMRRCRYLRIPEEDSLYYDSIDTTVT